MPTLEFEEKYSLFGIKSRMKDFSLVYFLNQILSANFYREKNDISIIEAEKEVFFSLFSCYDPANDNFWSIIKNQTMFKSNIITENNLFADEKTIKSICLIPEYKHFDFLIKITGLVFNKKEIISLITNMKIIELITEIPPESLSEKSRSNLCF